MGIFVRAMTSIAFVAVFSPAAIAATASADVVPGEYLVKIKDSATVLDNHSLGVSLSAQVLREIPERRIFVVKRSLVETTTSAVKNLSSNPLVEVAEPNFVYHVDKSPNDVDFGKLWGLRNVGQADSRVSGTPGIDIDAEKAWDLTTGSDQVVVAVIDTGVDYKHQDLKENIWINEAEKNGQPGVDDDGNGYVDDIYGYNFSDTDNLSPDPLDDNGHGSHCAGTIGARGNDASGVVGVNWKVKIMPVKFLGAAGGGTLESAILAIDYATKMKANILSNSWGGGGESQLLKEAIQRSADAGALFVAASGNDGVNTDLNPHYPSTYPVDNILSVAAIDNQGELASFSNYGRRTVQIAAPGLNIFSTFMDGGYEWLSGTSMATPHVSGVAALLLAQEPTLSAADLKKRIMTTGKFLPSLRNKVTSGGLVNAFNALTNVQMPADPDDPFLWPSLPLSISSPHPYAKDTKESIDIAVPGAKEFALYFEKFETERNFDKASFYDHDGNLLFMMTGFQSDSFTPTIKGDWVRMEFTSDKSVEKYGFDLTKANYR